MCLISSRALTSQTSLIKCASDVSKSSREWPSDPATRFLLEVAKHCISVILDSIKIGKLLSK